MKPQISILGLGWGSVGFLQNIDTNIYDIEVFSLDNEFVYTPLLAQNIRQRKRLSLHGNQIIKGAKFTNREISNIDFDTQTLISKTKEKYIYRYLVLSHGASINTFNIPGVEQYTYFLKNDHHAEMIRKKLQSLPIHSRVAVIGCGLTAIQLWKKNDIDIRMNQIVSSISENTIQFKNKTEIPYDMAIWCGGIKKSSLTDSILSTLKIENNKGIPVNKSLKVENTKNVWAIGDCAFTGLPPTAQVAYQQGSYLAHQFNSHFKDLSEFQFQNKGQIGYIGNKQSVCQLPYFQSGGNLTFYLNKLIHVYNGVTWKQKFYIFND